MKLPGRCSPLRRRVAPPLAWALVCVLAALSALAVPASKTRFEHLQLGYLRKGVTGQDDASLTLMVDHLPGVRRTMLLYYLHPAARQMPGYGISVPMSPDPALTAAGVALVRASDIENKADVLALARRGGGGYWNVVPKDLAVMGAAVMLWFAAIAMVTRSLVWRGMRRRATRRIDAVDGGLCPRCRYTVGVAMTRPDVVCPECAARPIRVRRRAVTLLARSRSCRGWRWKTRPRPYVI